MRLARHITGARNAPSPVMNPDSGRPALRADGGKGFSRVETRRRAGKFVLGLLADLPRKNCWSIAETWLRPGDPASSSSTGRSTATFGAAALTTSATKFRRGIGPLPGHCPPGWRCRRSRSRIAMAGMSRPPPTSRWRGGLPHPHPAIWTPAPITHWRVDASPAPRSLRPRAR